MFFVFFSLSLSLLHTLHPFLKGYYLVNRWTVHCVNGHQVMRSHSWAQLPLCAICLGNWRKSREMTMNMWKRISNRPFFLSNWFNTVLYLASLENLSYSLASDLKITLFCILLMFLTYCFESEQVLYIHSPMCLYFVSDLICSCVHLILKKLLKKNRIFQP